MADTEDDITRATAELIEGTHTGPLETPAGTVEPSSKRISIDASVWFRFQGETISEIHHYLDVAILLEQIGAVPASPR